MAARSLTASESGIAAVKRQLTARKWSYEDLGEAAKISRATAINFCTGKKPVDRKNFVACCETLGLDWEEIAGLKISTQPIEVASNMDELVRQVREASAAGLRQRCGTMRILDMTQPIDSGAIYTDVNILERVAGKTRREIQELIADCGVEQFDRFFLSGVKQKRVGGMKAVLEKQTLMILGRPGAGKTTFLKRLAILCLNGDFLGDRLPIFVTLKEFAEADGTPGIIDFMGGDRAALIQILRSGRALVLLDGLDEVMEKDHDRVIKNIRYFAETYGKNHIVATCRIAAQEYIFQQFTEVEMADFNDQQIQIFANRWFKAKECNPESTTGNLFWQELEKRKPVKELATNPLLLTLLCLEFDNSSAFPQSRSELYERALNVLLAKWDGQRKIKRDEVYKGLSLKRKETMLGQLAMHTFARGDYFFKERVATEQIENYIRHLPGASEDSEILLLDSRAVLKSLESQHGLLAERATGIYSFSHLTFHEYFTAKNILSLSSPAAQDAVLQQLIPHLGEKRWKEVFLLAVEGFDDADYLLISIKNHIDSRIKDEPKLQQFLQWTQEKFGSVSLPYKPAAIRAYHYVLDLDPTLELARAIDRDLDLDLDLDCVLARARARNLDLDRAHDNALARSIALDRAFALDRTLALTRDLAHYRSQNIDLVIAQTVTQAHDPELQRQLQDILDRFPTKKTDQQILQWWDQQGQQWTEDLRQIMITHRNVGHDWQFTYEQQQKLKDYYDANLFLVDCLNSECYVSREVREEIEATMLLSMEAIDQWHREHRPEHPQG